MFDRVTIRVADSEASQRFYDTVLTTLGIEMTAPSRWRDFALAAADAAHPPTSGLHIGFVAPSREHVDAFWRAGTEAGYADDGPPGPRPQYREDYYGAFLRDPDGNSAEAVHDGALRRGGAIDHLWIRVADVAAAKRFYEEVAARGGLRLGDDTPERVQFRGSSGSFSLVAGTPTENVELTLPGDRDADLVDPDGNEVNLVALYAMPRAVPVPNLGRMLRPPPPGSRLWRFLNFYSGANLRLYRASGGRIGGRMGRAPVLLLEHVGRKSGTRRVAPVLFLADGDRLVIVGSKGGAARDPAWVANLEANPSTTVQVARRRISVRARPATDEERARYWPRLVEIYPSYATYQQRTSRVLPVVVLEPES